MPKLFTFGDIGRWMKFCIDRRDQGSLPCCFTLLLLQHNLPRKKQEAKGEGGKEKSMPVGCVIVADFSTQSCVSSSFSRVCMRMPTQQRPTAATASMSSTDDDVEMQGASTKPIN
jgi:hypothetical protein